MTLDYLDNDNIYVFRNIEPIYTKKIKKNFFRTIEEQVKTGDCAVYTVNEDYITPRLRIEVICGDNVTAKDIKIFAANVRGYWETLNLPDEQRMNVWRKAKKLYNAQQTRMQEPQYWSDKLKELKKQKQQAVKTFVDDILDVLNNTEFLPAKDWDAWYDSSSQMHFYGDVAPYIYKIKRYGYTICYYEGNKQMIINDKDEKKSILFILPNINYTQAQTFISVCKRLRKLKQQQRLHTSGQKDLDKSITDAKNRYDKAKQTNPVSGSNEFIQKIR